MRAGRRWASCKGVRSNLRKWVPAKPKPLVPLIALHARRREATVDLKVLWGFLGKPGWKLWCRLLERAGVPRKRKGGQRVKLTHVECRRVLETRYRELGADTNPRNPRRKTR